MGLHLLMLTLGFILLLKGADWLVEGGSALAGKYGISELATGLTVVAFGTSAPELVVNVYASLQGYPDVIYGNIIGSNIFNLFAILGIAGLLVPLTVQSRAVWKEIPLSLLAVAGLIILSNDKLTGIGEEQSLERADAGILAFLFVGFLFYMRRQLKSNESGLLVSVPEFRNAKVVLLLLAGLAGLVIGGQMVMNYGVKIAELYQLSERMIGLTIIAAGTSLPELATTVVAALKRKSDIAVGNVLGSNIFNILFILSMSAFIHPIPYEEKFNTHLYFLLAGTCFLFLTLISGSNRKVNRWQSVLLFVTFLGYTYYLILSENLVP